MGVITPWALNALSGAPLYDAPTLRNLHGAALLGGQSAMLPLPGCLDPRALQVDVSSDPLVTVSAGLAVVTTAAGPYITGLDASWSGNLAARHASFSRIDLVVLEVRDTTLLRDAVVRIIPGTAAASPVAPAAPAASLTLGRITVPPSTGGQASVVDQRLFTAAQGGIIFVPDAAARGRLANPAVGTGLYAHEVSTGITWKNAGTAWAQIHPPVAAPRPHVWLARTTAFTITPATLSTVTGWDLSDASGLTVNAATGIITVTAAGWYEVSFGFHWTANAAGGRTAQLVRTRAGVDTPVLADNRDQTGTRATPMTASATLSLQAGDSLALRIVHSGSVALGPDVTAQPVYLSVGAA